MTKKNQKIIVIIGIIIIGIISLIIIKRALREEANLIFPDSIVVENNTKYDTEKIVKAITYNIMGIDSIKIYTVYMLPNLELMGGMKIQAFVNKNPFNEKEYFIFLSSKLNQRQLKQIFAHEIYHISQMERGDLIQLGTESPISIWKGDTINLKLIKYEYREYEIEAKNRKNNILRKLDKIWYK